MCFEDEEVITVGSSAYNLAGDVERRGNFMKNNVLSLIFSGISKKGLGKGIVDAHLEGPAISLNRFNRWAESSGYNTQVGNMGGLVYSASSLSTEGFEFLVPVKIAAIVPVPAEPPYTRLTHDQRAISFTIGAIDLHLIALEWIINNAPANRDLPFVATLEKVGSSFTGKILISYTSGATASFTPAYNLNNNMPFAYLYHEERKRAVPVIIDTGWVTLEYPELPPSRASFVNGTITILQEGVLVPASVVASGSPNVVVEVVSLPETTTTVVTYSDSTPSTTTVTSETIELNFDKTTGEYTKITTVVTTPTIKSEIITLVQNEESFYNILYVDIESSSSEVVEGVTVTTTVTVNTPYLQTYWAYKQVTTKLKQDKWLPYLLKIYQKGSSSTGDALLFNTPTTIESFFPVIPLRRDNVMVDLANFPTQYGWNRKATRKCFGSKKKYDTLIESLADNESLEDIDHAWVVFGVSLSTKQQDGLKYLYEFFKTLADTTIVGLGTYKSASAYQSAWEAFLVASETSTNDETEDDVNSRPLPPVAQEYTIAINASAAVQDWLFNTTITAKGGDQVVGSGYHAKALGKVGNAWVYAKSTITIRVPVFDNEGRKYYENKVSTIIAFGKQVTSSIWVEYEFFDLVHTNNVYQGVTATTLGTTVIASTDENSSFIVPLHQEIFNQLTLVRGTQLSLECSFLVVNYYDKQTIPWYASGFFQIVLVVVVIVVAVYTGYIGPESAGIFGTNAAVGATIGFTGTAAILAGAIANAVGAAIVASMLTKVSVAAFGEDIGKLVGFIASAITINMMSSTGSFSLADSWAQMTKADNLLKLTMSGVQEYGNYMQGQAMEINAQTQALLLEADTAMKDLNKLMQELLGDTGVDPSTITDAMRYATENPEQFLSRTTMTGTDIAELSIKLVEDFPASQLALPYLD